MNREQFTAATAKLGEAELRTALWTVYWRGTAAVRERIEDILAPEPAVARSAPQAADPEQVLQAVQDFTALVRSGAYLAGSRAVRPKERSRWRFTFRRLLAESRAALAHVDPASAELGLTEMIDLACEFRDYDYVRSPDPIEAAAVVVSEEVEVLWRHQLGLRGFVGFSEQAAAQFLRWESVYGWTRGGWGKIAGRESRLADVLAGLLIVPDTWVTFTEHYIRVLDDVATPPVLTPGNGKPRPAAQRHRELDPQGAERARTMIHWHLILLDRFAGTQDDAVLDRIALHPAFSGPEHLYFRARLAHARGDVPEAHQLIFQALERLPGHSAFLNFAIEIDAALPSVAIGVAASRRPPEP